MNHASYVLSQFLVKQGLVMSSAHAEDATPPAPASTSEAVPSTTSVPAAAAQPGVFGMLFPFVLMFGVMYFLIIRPQQKKMKEHQSKVETIKSGDEIISNSGLIGKVYGVTDRVLTVEIADNVRVKMLKSQVAAINPDLATFKGIEAPRA